MKKSVLVAIMTLGMGFVLLFQNCSQLESQKVPELSIATESNNDITIIPPIPEPPVPPQPAVDLSQRFVLDNLQPAGFLDFDLSVGDVLHYETDFRSMSMLTLVTIQYINGVNVISVSGDSCTNQAALTFAEYDGIFKIIADAGSAALPKAMVGNEMMRADCAFPRLGLDGINAKIDYQLYTAPRECVPENALYNTTHSQQMNTWFNSKIDDLCGQN